MSRLIRRDDLDLDQELRDRLAAGLTEYRVTFGQRYAYVENPAFKPASPNGWLTIYAPCEQDARDAVAGELGAYWSALYPIDVEWIRTADREFYPLGELACWFVPADPLPGC
jgi:hypothetical protein